MSRFNSIIRALSLAMAAILVDLPALAQPVVIKFSHFMPPNSTFHTQVAQPWCAAIEKDSQGRMKCQIFPALQLGGTPAQLADQVKNGIADVVWTSPSYSTGRFPRTEALELPFSLPPGGLESARAAWEYVDQHASDDYKDFKVLAALTVTNVVFATAKKPILDLEDFRGLKLRVPTHYAAEFLKALGSAPVSMPVTQVTEGIAKGVVDGVIVPWEVITSTKIDEVTHYFLEGPPNQVGFLETPTTLLMNKQAFERLPSDLKAIVDKNSGLLLSEQAGRAWDAANETARKKIAGSGSKILSLKDADFEAMKAATASVEADWIKQANARGLEGRKLAASVHAIGKKYLAASK